MNFLSLLYIEIKKTRRSKILLILLAPVMIMWLPAILNADKIFITFGIPIAPEYNYFIQGFMGMVWFMIPATLVICTVLISQTERTNNGIIKMLSLPVNKGKLCLAKFIVILLLAAVQMLMAVGTYYISTLIASRIQDYSFLLKPLYVFSGVAKFYLAALPMAAVYWMLTVLIRIPIFSVGIGLACAVPSVLMINTDYWFLHPMSYPFYVLMTEYGKAAEGIYTTTPDWIPWIPAALCITVVCLSLSCIRFGHAETR